MKTTRRTAVILAIWIVCTVVYAGTYFARSDTYNFNSTLTRPTAAGTVVVVMPIPAPPVGTTPLPIQRVFKTKTEAILFVPAGLIESLLTGEDITITHGKLFFGC